MLKFVLGGVIQTIHLGSSIKTTIVDMAFNATTQSQMSEVWLYSESTSNSDMEYLHILYSYWNYKSFYVEGNLRGTLKSSENHLYFQPGSSESYGKIMCKQNHISGTASMTYTTISSIPSGAADVRVNTPSFYSNYTDLSSLASALGVTNNSYKSYDTVNVGDTISIASVYSVVLFIDNAIGYTALLLKGYMSYKLVEENYTGTRKYSFNVPSDNILYATLEGDSNGGGVHIHIYT